MGGDVGGGQGPSGGDQGAPGQGGEGEGQANGEGQQPGKEGEGQGEITYDVDEVIKVFNGDDTIDLDNVRKSIEVAQDDLKAIGVTQDQLKQLAPIHAKMVKAMVQREMDEVSATTTEVIEKRESALKEILEKPADAGGLGYKNWDPESTDHPAKIDMIRGLFAMAPGDQHQKTAVVEKVIADLDASGAVAIVLPFFARIGQISGEDFFKQGLGRGRPEKSRVEQMYGDQK